MGYVILKSNRLYPNAYTNKLPANKTLHSLTTKVNDALANGATLAGGICINKDGAYLQAVVYPPT